MQFLLNASGIINLHLAVLSFCNKIAHIKNRQSKLVLNGKECEVYLKKLFLIYRSILLVLLKVPYESYKPKLFQLTKTIDEQPAIKEFLLKIKKKPVSKKQRM